MNAGRADQIRARRVRLGISVKALAMRAGIDRGTLASLEAGDERIRDSTFGTVERALEALEQEMGVEPGGSLADVVEFRVSGDFGVDVVVKGPVRDMAAMEESVARLLARIQSGRAAEKGDDSPSG
ncbi:MAG TPA: helix-turn-helix domain-containing protein [Gaiellaceae bacterium]|nr:helix-turn-helix domain-containing protein [Gaiellaceae bacterium]